MSRAREIASPNLNAFEYSPRNFGIDPTGQVDGTQAFLNALAAGNVKGHPGDKYLLGGITIPGGRTVEGNGAQVRPAPGASHVFRLTGYEPRLVDVNLDGYTENHVKKTTLTALVGVGVNVLPVASTAGFAIRMPVVVIQNGNAPHLTLITGIGANTLTVRDPLPAGSFSGAAVSGSFGLINIYNSTWAKVLDCSVVNGAFSLMAVNSTGPTVGAKSRVSNFDIDGEHYVGFAKFENVGDLVVANARLRGGLTQAQEYVGTGGAGPFALLRPVYLFRDLTVIVDGVPKTYGTHFTVAGNGMSISFTSGNYPGIGAAIQIYHFADGYFGFVDDQRCPSGIILPSGNAYSDLQVLDFNFGIKCSGAFLTDFSNVISDTCSDAALIVDNASSVDQSLSFTNTFLGYSPDAVQCYDATVKFFGRFESNLVPADQWRGGVLGKTVRTSGTAIVSVNTPGIVTNNDDFSWGGAGELQLTAGDIQRLLTGVLTKNGTSYIGLNGVEIGAGGTPIPTSSRGKIHRLIALPSAAPGVGESFFYEIFLNGSPSGISGMISGTELKLDVIDSIPYFANSEITVQVARSVNAAEVTHRILFVATGG